MCQSSLFCSNLPKKRWKLVKTIAFIYRILYMLYLFKLANIVQSAAHTKRYNNHYIHLKKQKQTKKKPNDLSETLFWEVFVMWWTSLLVLYWCHLWPLPWNWHWHVKCEWIYVKKMTTLETEGWIILNPHIFVEFHEPRDFWILIFPPSAQHTAVSPGH